MHVVAEAAGLVRDVDEAARLRRRAPTARSCTRRRRRRAGRPCRACRSRATSRACDTRRSGRSRRAASSASCTSMLRGDARDERAQRRPRERDALADRRLARAMNIALMPDSANCCGEAIVVPRVIDVDVIAVHEHDRRGGLRVVARRDPDVDRAARGLDAPVLAGRDELVEPALSAAAVAALGAGRWRELERRRSVGRADVEHEIGQRAARSRSVGRSARRCQQRDSTVQRRGQRTSRSSFPAGGRAMASKNLSACRVRVTWSRSAVSRTRQLIAALRDALGQRRAAAAAAAAAARSRRRRRGSTRRAPRSGRLPPRQRGTPPRSSGSATSARATRPTSCCSSRPSSRSPTPRSARCCPTDWAAQNGFVGVKSRVTDHREFLLRPDLGRRLDDESLADRADAVHARSRRPDHRRRRPVGGRVHGLGQGALRRGRARVPGARAVGRHADRARGSRGCGSRTRSARRSARRSR